TLMCSDNIAARHCFTTRYGGVSEGIFSSLNLTAYRGDNDEHVCENYSRVADFFGLEEPKFVFSRQIHTDNIKYCTKSDLHHPLDPLDYEADALITDEKFVPLVIQIADCTPILLWDGVKNVVAAVHAGWRSTALDIAGKTVRAMVRDFGCRAEDIHAAIGPCISQCCYETGPEVVEGIGKTLGSAVYDCAEPRGEKFYVDLKGINRAYLNRAGVTSVDISPECTMCSHEKYWSHRYTSGQRGGQTSIIMLS
ncbi:MAG: peptidoglycan editing factor PgeF, partial [Oscillospiraceae bacterium]|nr:peptidoglycan editing factor PgeF [Oscillospiraceae bacterium]